MPINTKSHAGVQQVKHRTPKSTYIRIDLAAHIKAKIVTLALWGLLPVVVADWLIHRGGLRDV